MIGIPRILTNQPYPGSTYTTATDHATAWGHAQQWIRAFPENDASADEQHGEAGYGEQRENVS